ncbi:PspA/IM30 family protein [Guptibacillus hwajinpoensis]|uniref:PspA/IM30 family protein n=1 Tax=Guptibacillus hwajinpoensis TaxID=208199 RepID=UPI003510BD0C
MMTSLINRIKTSIEADFHSILDQKEEKNPIAHLNHYVRQCEQEVEKAGKLIERQSMLKGEFERELHKARMNVEKRARQADLAKVAGEEELYEYAKQDQLQYEERAEWLSQSMDEASKELARLEQKYEKMKHKLKDLTIKRMELMGKENSLRAHHKMDVVLNQSQLDESFNRFDEIQKYIEKLENKMNRQCHMSTNDAKLLSLEKNAKRHESDSNS